MRGVESAGRPLGSSFAFSFSSGDAADARCSKVLLGGGTLRNWMSGGLSASARVAQSGRRRRCRRPSICAFAVARQLDAQRVVTSDARLITFNQNAAAFSRSSPLVCARASASDTPVEQESARSPPTRDLSRVFMRLDVRRREYKAASKPRASGLIVGEPTVSTAWLASFARHFACACERDFAPPPLAVRLTPPLAQAPSSPSTFKMSTLVWHRLVIASIGA